MAETRHKRFLLLALGGILTGLTLIFPKAGFAEWLTLVPVGIFLLSEADAPHTRLRGTYGYGFFFFMCYYIVVFHWFIYLYPLDFISGMTPLSAMAVVLAGSVGLSALQATGGGLMFIAVRLLLRTGFLRGGTLGGLRVDTDLGLVGRSVGASASRTVTVRRRLADGVTARLVFYHLFDSGGKPLCGLRRALPQSPQAHGCLRVGSSCV